MVKQPFKTLHLKNYESKTDGTSCDERLSTVNVLSTGLPTLTLYIHVFTQPKCYQAAYFRTHVVAVAQGRVL